MRPGLEPDIGRLDHAPYSGLLRVACHQRPRRGGPRPHQQRRRRERPEAGPERRLARCGRQARRRERLSSAIPQVKIPLPPSLQRVEGAMRAFGMSKQADELVLTMNRAAEAAVPEAKQLLVDAVKKMSRAGREGDPHRRRYRRPPSTSSAAPATAAHPAFPADREEGHRQSRPRAAVQLARRPGRRARAGQGGPGDASSATSPRRRSTASTS